MQVCYRKLRQRSRQRQKRQVRSKGEATVGSCKPRTDLRQPSLYRLQPEKRALDLSEPASPHACAPWAACAVSGEMVGASRLGASRMWLITLSRASESPRPGRYAKLREVFQASRNARRQIVACRAGKTFGVRPQNAQWSEIAWPVWRLNETEVRVEESPSSLRLAR